MKEIKDTWSVEGLEHNLSHLFSICLGVQRSFSQQDWVFLWCNSEFVVEGVIARSARVGLELEIKTK